MIGENNYTIKNDCWEWNSRKDKNGYGVFTLNKKPVKAHRYSYELYNGPIINSLHVLHKCDNPSCINPAHLFLGTAADNAKDRNNKGRTKGAAGELNSHSKISSLDVLFIRSSTDSNTVLSKKFNIHRNTVYKIRSNKSWKHIKERLVNGKT